MRGFDGESAYSDVQGRIAAACAAAGRERDEVTLMAVSKRQPEAAVRALAALGQRDFGENLVQAWQGRTEALADHPELRWHLIGPVQTNKAKYIARTPPAMLHTVDRSTLVEALERHLDAARPLPVLVQVNIDREPQKSGCLEENLDDLVDYVCGAQALSFEGLMCIPRFGPLAETRRAFAALRELGERVRDRVTGPRLELSMGMSADFEAAIAEGATLVRVGTALFGERE
ncbi:MAG: YggS family pyridoxal phosphate-dependent enzyme [Deltaproteobacteria bacterium HGW-Deltaproteobacteria-14]|jgi:hypothetical protein|nr:MAG: YggS family pyridoxal phosphate-dependent enzyme [Deltaproteobacteria bacterium HGW-Deltaproteobacteria-14]